MFTPNNRALSVRLYDILENIGVSERSRNLLQVSSVVKELADTLTCRYVEGVDSSVYVCGSTMEGTTTPGLNADLDIMFCNNDVPITEDLEPYVAVFNNGFVVIKDDTTYPGYVKLQILKDGLKQLSNYDNRDDTVGSDRRGRMCLKHILKVDPGQIGPAVAEEIAPNFLSTDIVFAKSCQIPSLANTWKNRPWIAQNFPNLQEVDCLLVPVGYPSSPERDLEWRISFTLQERFIMRKLNSTQVKCYVLLKMLVKDCINVHGNIISSYHCKTCLFHIIEKTRENEWIPENLIRLTMICLMLFTHWIRNRNSPDYFIPNQNMLEVHLNDENTRRRLLRTITNLVNDGCKSFLRIRCDNIGEQLLNIPRPANSDQVIQRYEYSLMVHVCKTLVEFKKQMHLLGQSYSNQTQVIEMLYTIKFQLQHIRYNPNSDANLIDAVSCLMPSIDLQLTKRLAETLSRIDETPIPSERLIEECLEHFCLSNSSDLMNSRLLFVSLLYSCRQYEACLENLQDIEAMLTTAVISVCSCTKAPHTANNTLLDIFSGNQMTFQNVIQSSVASCIIFQPVDNNIVPFPLKFEMCRSLCTPNGSRNESLDFWFDWAVVDAKVYLYFMQYMVCSKLSMDAQKMVAIDNINWLVREEPNLGHRETAYNLLGWIYIQERDLRKACWCLTDSWKIRPLHNAAKWHVLSIGSHYRQSAVNQN